MRCGKIKRVRRGLKALEPLDTVKLAESSHDYYTAAPYDEMINYYLICCNYTKNI
ncbi:hypothetical protein [Clostridium psychrophilum]|uniref:hypothetical protein n=1 Tax=Clostridium psychrophilum TaxID=132926 RepID=UPI001C0B5B90|nr:hypothetical protein [Clostridium psychrophilum]MBU3183056.1 hypothetical protein [Clostridium psychrophilum]